MKSTHQSFSISFVCGPPGSGKSFCVTRDIIDRLCSSSFTGIIYTNLPLEVDRIAAFVAGKTGAAVDDVRARMVLLDKETLRKWKAGEGGPWEPAESYTGEGHFGDGNDFILDECHNFCPKSGKTAGTRNERWQLWLGEVRHEGWRRVMFVTQDEAKVGQAILIHSELRFELTNSERRRDPIFRIPLGQWYELVASVTREYRSGIIITEYRRVKGKLREEHVERLELDPQWFAFYRSYEAAGGGAGDGKSGTAVLREFQRRPIALPGRREGRLILPTWLWFIRVNWWRFTLATIVVVGMGWLTLGGGLNVLIRAFMGRLSAVASSNGARAPKSPAKPGEPEQVLAAPGETADVEAPARGTPEEIAAVLAGLPTAERDMLRAELAAFADARRRAEVRLKQRAAELAAQQKLVKVVAVTKTSAWFTDPPCSCQIGEVLDEGPYRGKRVERLNVDRGWVDLSGGVRLWIGRGVVDGLPDAATADGGEPDAANARGTGPRFPEPLPAVDPTAQSRRPEEAGGAPHHDLGAGDELRSLLKRGSAPVGAVDRGE